MEARAERMKALAAGVSQIGVKETTGNNDGPPSTIFADGRQEPWCADFVVWCFHKRSTLRFPGKEWMLPSVSYMQSLLEIWGQFVVREAAQPEPGDVIFFANRGASDPSKMGRHVGIVESTDERSVYTVEGNTSNQVARRTYSRNNPRIVGYGRLTKESY